MVAPSEGAEHVRDEVARAVALLSQLTVHDPPENPLGALNPKALFRSKAVFFYHTCKVGLGFGFKWGSGILVTHLQDEDGNVSWSAPCLYKVKEASFGLLAGAGRVQTLLLLGTRKAVDHFKGGHATIGSDFKVMAGSDPGYVAEDAGSGDHHDAVCLSMADGAIVDFTINGGKISVDTAANEALYGPGVTPDVILATSASNTPISLPGVSELYDALNAITADAKSDPRKFKGFDTQWKPQSVLEPLATHYRKIKEQVD